MLLEVLVTLFVGFCLGFVVGLLKGYEIRKKDEEYLKPRGRAGE
jgi:hypothetical protein